MTQHESRKIFPELRLKFLGRCAGNILLDKYNAAKLADVGLAKILTSTHGNDKLSTFLETADLGTFSWASPEVQENILSSHPNLLFNRLSG